MCIKMVIRIVTEVKIEIDVVAEEGCVMVYTASEQRCYAMLCCTMLCYAMLCYYMQHCGVISVLYHTARTLRWTHCINILHQMSCALWCCAVLFISMLYSTCQYDIVRTAECGAGQQYADQTISLTRIFIAAA